MQTGLPTVLNREWMELVEMKSARMTTPFCHYITADYTTPIPTPIVNNTWVYANHCNLFMFTIHTVSQLFFFFPNFLCIQSKRPLGLRQKYPH